MPIAKQGMRGRMRALPLWLLWAVLLLLPLNGWAVELQLSRLAEAPENIKAADVATVSSGGLDTRFVTQAGPVIYQNQHDSQWWRIRIEPGQTLPAEPILLLEDVYLTRVMAVIPGMPASVHSLYGTEQDRRYSTRALAIALPQSLPPDASVYLRVESPASVPIRVSIQSRAAVHEDDLSHVAWRSMVLTIMVIIGVLAFAFWVGIGDISFLYLAGVMLTSALYVAAIGGEARSVPWLDALFSQSRKLLWTVGCLGVASANQFIRSYLELDKRMPRWDRLMRALAIAMILVAAIALVFDQRWVATVGNIGVVSTATAVLAVTLVQICRGNRSALFILGSWLPIIVAASMTALQMQGLFPELPWLRYALAASQGVAGVMLMVGMADRLTRLRNDRDQANRDATVDALTGAWSRKYAHNQLAQLVQQSARSKSPLSVAYIDIDRFKQINDTHGHHIGDGCLRFVVTRLRNVLRGGDVLGRLGGDEMVVLMPNTDIAQAIAVCERMRESVGMRALTVDDICVSATLSIGVAQWRTGETADQLLERADKALYASKSAGRDRVSGAASTPNAIKEAIA